MDSTDLCMKFSFQSETGLVIGAEEVRDALFPPRVSSLTRGVDTCTKHRFVLQEDGNTLWLRIGRVVDRENYLQDEGELANDNTGPITGTGRLRVVDGSAGRLLEFLYDIDDDEIDEYDEEPRALLEDHVSDAIIDLLGCDFRLIFRTEIVDIEGRPYDCS